MVITPHLPATVVLPARPPQATADEPMAVADAQRLSELLAALADPTRLRILTALETVCVPVGAVVQATGLSQPTVSHHLRILRDRGMLRAERRGQYVYYCLSTDAVRPAIEAVRMLLDARSPR